MAGEKKFLVPNNLSSTESLSFLPPKFFTYRLIYVRRTLAR